MAQSVSSARGISRSAYRRIPAVLLDILKYDVVGDIAAGRAEIKYGFAMHAGLLFQHAG